MSVLATAKQDCHLHFVIVLEKVNRLFHFEVDVVFASLGANSNFLQSSLVRLVFSLTFFLVVIEFTEVHDSANGWLRFFGDFYQIEACGLCFFNGVLRWNNSQLVSVLIDDANRRNSDLIIGSVL